MKHLLYGTTALVAAGLIAGAAAPARADDKPIQITIGGYFYAFFDVTQSHPGVVDTVSSALEPANTPAGQPATALDNKGMKVKSRIQFDGRTQLDNGLVAGLRVQLRGNTGDSNQIANAVAVKGGIAAVGASVGSSSEDQIDEHFLFLDSATYGRMEAGATASAPRKMWYGAVTPAMPYHGINSPNFIEFPGGQAGVVLSQPTTLLHSSGQTDRADKVSYYTPRIAGFQLGISYAPTECNSNDISSSTGGPSGAVNLQCHFLGSNQLDNVAGQFKNIWSGGLNYVNKFGDFNLGTYAGFEHSTAETSTNLSLSPGFTIVGGALVASNIASATLTERDRNEFGAGFSLAAYGFSGGASFRFDNQGTSRSLTAGSFAQTNRYDVSGGLSYGQGPWSIGGSMTYVVADEKNVNGQGPSILNTPTATFQDQDVGYYEAVGANYAIGPGVNINAAIEHMDVSAAVNNAAISNHSWLYTIGTALNF
jgi:hypothetical protein